MKIKLFHLDLLIELEPTNLSILTSAQVGTVLLAGPAHAGEENAVKIGDKILIRAPAAHYLEIDGKKCALTNAEGLLWRFEAPKPPAPGNGRT